MAQPQSRSRAKGRYQRKKKFHRQPNKANSRGNPKGRAVIPTVATAQAGIKRRNLASSGKGYD